MSNLGHDLKECDQDLLFDEIRCALIAKLQNDAAITRFLSEFSLYVIIPFNFRKLSYGNPCPLLSDKKTSHSGKHQYNVEDEEHVAQSIVNERLKLLNWMRDIDLATPKGKEVHQKSEDFRGEDKFMRFARECIRKFDPSYRSGSEEKVTT